MTDPAKPPPVVNARHYPTPTHYTLGGYQDTGVYLGPRLIAYGADPESARRVCDALNRVDMVARRGNTVDRARAIAVNAVDAALGKRAPADKRNTALDAVFITVGTLAAAGFLNPPTRRTRP